ncbi:sirohydrochlorin chelatase [Mobilicoccus caccae]|uniref:Cobalamin biosynthesis protein CbiX n=1 Tax=Mobilicoccus caccae TaxID=1859295 RepID=A0ABQ6IWQ4_9MICO|nr:CbiX/SirB N-terminal domain-containing protein [Mobilicoccus caccae]GMA41129.1 cobalamin biosynthesis protein CbiX [Mobilicoccus caccae]
MTRPLVLAAHGTENPDGRAVVEQVAARAAALLGVEHRVGYVDVCGPTLAEVLASLVEAGGAAGQGGGTAAPVVVPFFLSRGYHVRYDVPSAVAAMTPARTASDERRFESGGADSSTDAAVVTPALGAEPEVVEALTGRILEADPTPRAVVLAAAGSGVAAAREEVAEVARLVQEKLGIPVEPAFLSGPGPRPEDVVSGWATSTSDTTRTDPAPTTHGSERGGIVVAAHLLAPGFFLEKAARVAVEIGGVATGPLATHPSLVNLVLRRYRQAL